MASAGCNSTRSTPASTPAAFVNQHPIQDDGTTHIAEYQVPTLAGWERETTQTTSTNIQSVKFKKAVDGTTILTKVVFFTMENAPLDTAASLAESVQSAERTSEKMGENRQTLRSEPTTYRGHPAYLTQQLLRKGDKVTESQILRVADGRHTFWFTQSLAGKPIAASARTVAAEAWRTVMNDFK